MKLRSLNGGACEGAGVQRSDCGESEWSFLWTCSSRQFLQHRRASSTVDLSLAVVYYNDTNK